jgi:uncharacterized DUF497 family protein
MSQFPALTIHWDRVIVFDWDSANLKHLAQHGVTAKEFEEAMVNDPEELYYDVVKGEERYHSAGMTNTGRLLFLVWTVRREKIRAVTAFDAPRVVQKEWEKRR